MNEQFHFIAGISHSMLDARLAPPHPGWGCQGGHQDCYTPWPQSWVACSLSPGTGQGADPMAAAHPARQMGPPLLTAGF